MKCWQCLLKQLDRRELDYFKNIYSADICTNHILTLSIPNPFKSQAHLHKTKTHCQGNKYPQNDELGNHGNKHN